MQADVCAHNSSWSRFVLGEHGRGMGCESFGAFAAANISTALLQHGGQYERAALRAVCWIVMGAVSCLSQALTHSENHGHGSMV